MLTIILVFCWLLLTGFIGRELLSFGSDEFHGDMLAVLAFLWLFTSALLYFATRYTDRATHSLYMWLGVWVVVSCITAPFIGSWLKGNVRVR